MTRQYHWLLTGGLLALLALAPQTAWGQERGRTTGRDARDARDTRSSPTARSVRDTRHTTGSVRQPTPRPPGAHAPHLDQPRPPTLSRPGPVVLPPRAPAYSEYRGSARRTVTIPRTTRVVRGTRPAVTVVDRRITRPTYRPIRWGTTVTRLPERHMISRYGETTYFIADGVYYIRGGRPTEYVVVRPPIGVRVAYLPSDAVVVEISRRTYYFYDDVWYDDALTVVDCPYGGWRYTLPEEYDVVEYGEDRYYRVGSEYYEPSWRDGRSVYLKIELSF